MANRISKTSVSLSNPPLLIGVDIGYGHTKVVSNVKSPDFPDGSLIFPSVMAFAGHIHYGVEELTRRYKGDQITDDDGSKWFIGNLAVSQVNPNELLRLRGRTNDSALAHDFRLRMFKAALGKLMNGTDNGDIVHVRMVTGLPVEHMRDSAALRSLFMGDHLIKTDCAHFVASVSEVLVIPQPYGSVFNTTLTDLGTYNPAHKAVCITVVDVGHHTVDLTVDQKGQPINHKSGSVEAGVHIAYGRLKDEVNARFKAVVSDADIDTLIRTRKFRAHGQDHSMAKEVNDALTPLRTATVSLMMDKIQNGAMVDAIYVSGGGAELVVGAVAEAYPENLVQVMPNAQLANAQGFYNYLMLKASQH